MLGLRQAVWRGFDRRTVIGEQVLGLRQVLGGLGRIREDNILLR